MELISEEEAIADATGAAPLVYPRVHLAALRGRHKEAAELFASVDHRMSLSVQWATAVLHNGLADCPAALNAAKQAIEYDPRVTLTVLDGDDWYTHVTLIGRVVETHDDEGLKDIDRLATHYIGKPYPDRVRARVSAWIEVDRWHGWGAMKDSDQAAG
jgi:hypothetical protein